jgi:hypothetical protein
MRVPDAFYGVWGALKTSITAQLRASKRQSKVFAASVMDCKTGFILL